MLRRALAAVPVALALVVAPLAVAPAMAAPANVTVTATAGVEGGAPGIHIVVEPGYDPFSVTIDTSSGTAIEGVDFTNVHEVIPFGGTGTLDLGVPTIQDAAYEGDETLTITLSDITGGANFSTTSIQLTITDDDAAPTFTINDVTASEGDAGTTNFGFTITKTGESALSSSISFTINPGSATRPADFGNLGGARFFPPGGTATAPVNVPVVGDTLYEGDEQFTITLSDPIGGTISDGEGVGTITDDDSLPSINLTPEFPTVSEGDSGDTTTLTFSVDTLATVAVPITFDVLPVDESATIDEDYSLPATTFTIDPGETDVEFTVEILGDGAREGTESFRLELDDVENGAIGERALAIVEITDDDPASGGLAVTGSDPTPGFLLAAILMFSGLALLGFSALRLRLVG